MGQYHLFNRHVIRVPEREKRLNIAELEKKKTVSGKFPNLIKVYSQIPKNLNKPQTG